MSWTVCIIRMNILFQNGFNTLQRFWPVSLAKGDLLSLFVFCTK